MGMYPADEGMTISFRVKCRNENCQIAKFVPCNYCTYSEDKDLAECKDDKGVYQPCRILEVLAGGQHKIIKHDGEEATVEESEIRRVEARGTRKSGGVCPACNGYRMVLQFKNQKFDCPKNVREEDKVPEVPLKDRRTRRKW